VTDSKNTVHSFASKILQTSSLHPLLCSSARHLTQQSSSTWSIQHFIVYHGHQNIRNRERGLPNIGEQAIQHHGRRTRLPTQPQRGYRHCPNRILFHFTLPDSDPHYLEETWMAIFRWLGNAIALLLSATRGERHVCSSRPSGAGGGSPECLLASHPDRMCWDRL
jgi:hypothetical protein